MELIMGIWLVFVVIYLAPSIIACLRGHNSAAAIFVTNFLLGWSGLGWIVALIWAFTGNTRRNTVVRVQLVTPSANVVGVAAVRDALAAV